MVRVILAAELWPEYLESLVLQKGCVNVHHSAANVLAKVKIKNQMRVALTPTPPNFQDLHVLNCPWNH